MVSKLQQPGNNSQIMISTNFFTFFLLTSWHHCIFINIVAKVNSYDKLWILRQSSVFSPCCLCIWFQVCTLQNASRWLHQSLIIFSGFTVKLDFLLDYHTHRILMVITLIINKVSKIKKKSKIWINFYNGSNNFKMIETSQI